MEFVKDLARKVRWFIRSLIGKDVFFRTQVRKRAELIGGRPDSGYGGWAVCTEMLDQKKIIYSIGVGDDISFDLALIRRFDIEVHAFDPTPASHEWLSRQELPAGFHLHKYGVSGKDGTARFYPHENPEWVAHSLLKTSHTTDDFIEVPVRRLSSLMEMLGHDRIDLLKIDIEGSEYEVIDDLVDSNLDVRQLLVEFHHRMPELSPEQTRRAVARLNTAGFKIYYINPRGEEYSFFRE